MTFVSEVVCRGSPGLRDIALVGSMPWDLKMMTTYMTKHLAGFRDEWMSLLQIFKVKIS